MTARTPFEPVPTELDFPKYERRILELWRERDIFEKSLAERLGADDFVFYEGPPTANGVPHNGHVLTRVMKDIFPRYQSMRGKRVLRKGGWDTHGLPVEVEVEKELRIHGKAAIEEYGVEPFVARCIESVFRYTHEWERVTERLGFWLNLEEAYVTYHKSYVESVWWALSNLFDKGLLYQGHKVVWWWAQGGTALSSAEVGLGYKSVDDPSVYVAFPLLDDPTTALVVWTTTPWTLPSNGYAAVRPGTPYVVARIGADLAQKKGKRVLTLDAQKLIVAEKLLSEVEQKLGKKLEVEKKLNGEELVGTRYRPPFDTYAKDRADARVSLKAGGTDAMWWRVLAEDFVTLDTGTGIVHIAPAFGEDDNKAHKKQLQRYVDPDSVELLCAIDPNGLFRPEAGKYAGRWVKDADRDIVHELAERHILVAEELYRHDYPFCWRADEDPLIQMARPAWFIRTTERLDQAMANNQAVSWLPEHLKEGRFGDFLRNNVDWALSRERFWGTPLNVWICEKDENHKLAPSSIAEIEKLSPNAFAHFHAAKKKDPTLNEHLIVHKPWIDQVTFPCPTCSATMRRVPEVIDCWFDSGCMPFAQWGFPHVPGSRESFDAAFPADFISEAIDQTRGWFYSLLMISSLVFDPDTQKKVGLSHVRPFPHPYKTCIVLGHVGDKEGKKESKSKGNYTPPEIILDRVRMEFGVLPDEPADQVPEAEAWIAREDLEGMDLLEGATVALYRADDPVGTRRVVRVKGQKQMRRRLVLLSPKTCADLGLERISTGEQTMPVEVPRAPVAQRVTIEDESTPAPGADAFRWFFYASSPPWSNTRHSLQNVRMLQKDFVVKLRNVYSFFTIYANIDGWNPIDPAHAGRPIPERNLLDRWMLSELHLVVRDVRQALDGYLVYDAALRLIELGESLSNWYVRRSRPRFWAHGLEQDKCDAYATLYETLTTIAGLTAPFVPFFSDEMYQNLVTRQGGANAKESVHLTDFPEARLDAVDERLSAETAAVRQVVSLGLSVRTAHKIKVRQPLSRADIVFNDKDSFERLQSQKELIAEELNVEDVRFMFPGHEDGAVSFKLKPNFRALGPRLGKRVQEVKKALEGADGSALHAEMSQKGNITLTLGSEKLEFSPEEIEVAVEALPGFAAETGRIGVVVLHTTLTDELIRKGLVRELVSRIQQARKDLQLDFTDRVDVWVKGTEHIEGIARAAVERIVVECLVNRFAVGEVAPAGTAKPFVLGDESVEIAVTRSSD